MADPGGALVDVVDEDDRPVALVTRREMRARNLRHRCVFIGVVSTRDEVLIHRRADTKDVWPGYWDLAVGGVVEAGESYEAAAARELDEEIGITAPLMPLGSGRYQDADVDLLARIYRVSHDGPFRFRDGEVVEAFFVGPTELHLRLARDQFVPDSVALVVPALAGVLPDDSGGLTGTEAAEPPTSP